MRFRAIVLAVAFLVSTSAHALQPPPGCHLLFDGQDDQLPIIEPLASIGFGAFAQWTLSAWIKTTADKTQAIISRGEGQINDILPWAMGTSDGQVYVQIEGTDGSELFCLGNTLVNDGEWHFVVARRDEFNTVLIYIDDFDLSTMLPDVICNDAPDTTVDFPSQVPGVGFSYQSSAGPMVQPPALFFDGSIDEPALWRVPFTEAEIVTLRTNGPLGIQDVHLVGYWPLNEGSGQIAESYVGNLIIGLSELGDGINGMLGMFDDPDLSDPVWVCPAVPALGGAGRWFLGAALILALGVNQLRRWRPRLRN
jgi:hypothetical protein